ncbi:MAG: hypothetical protein VX228_06395 [Pseudomonadota bacterium]|nr:hypothetical protein [Pseudomonadota bacterium]
MLDFGNHQIHEPPSRRLERKVRAMRPKATWLPAPGFVFQEASGVTPAKEFGDPLGLVLDYFKSRLLGPNRVKNGAFETGSDWVFGNGWSISGGVAQRGGSGGGHLDQADVFEVGKTYLVTVKIQGIEVFPRSMANTNIFPGGRIATDGTHTARFTADSTGLRFYSGSGSGHIDSVEVREIPGVPLRQPNANSRPTLGIEPGNGPRSIRFDGIDDFLDATGLTAASGPKTVIAGCRTDDGETGVNEFLFDARVGRVLAAAVGSSAGQAGMYDGSWTAGGEYDTEAKAVLTFKHYAAGGGIRANGAEILTENVVEKPFGGSVTVGANFSVSGGFLDGRIYVMLVFDRALTALEIWICERWVAQIMGEIL